jgi:hypothetical protein
MSPTTRLRGSRQRDLLGTARLRGSRGRDLFGDKGPPRRLSGELPGIRRCLRASPGQSLSGAKTGDMTFHTRYNRAPSGGIMQSGIQTALTLGLVLVFGACKRPNQRDPAGARRAEAVPTGRPGASMSATPAAEVVPATDRGCGMAGFCWMRPAVGAASIPSVWSSSADNAWAVDASGRILHYDGRSWSVALRPVTSGLSRVWGTSAPGRVGCRCIGCGVALRWPAVVSGVDRHLV